MIIVHLSATRAMTSLTSACTRGSGFFSCCSLRWTSLCLATSMDMLVLLRGGINGAVWPGCGGVCACCARMRVWSSAAVPGGAALVSSCYLRHFSVPTSQKYVTYLFCTTSPSWMQSHACFVQPAETRRHGKAVQCRTAGSARRGGRAADVLFAVHVLFHAAAGARDHGRGRRR